MRGKGRDLPRPPGKVEVKAGVSLIQVAALDALGLPTPPQGPCTSATWIVTDSRLLAVTPWRP